jgi:hypothetical protein
MRTIERPEKNNFFKGESRWVPEIQPFGVETSSDPNGSIGGSRGFGD